MAEARFTITDEQLAEIILRLPKEIAGDDMQLMLYSIFRYYGLTAKECADTCNLTVAAVIEIERQQGERKAS